MDKNIIYGLFCPITNDLHYVGKSTIGLLRPLDHMTHSHSEKINDWVVQLKYLGYIPIIKILEVCTDENIDEREIYWIKKSITEGCYLLNKAHNVRLLKGEYDKANSTTYKIGNIIKTTRVNLDISADELSRKANISRPTLVSIEKGIPSTKISNIIKVLNVLGLNLFINRINGEDGIVAENGERVRATRRTH